MVDGAVNTIRFWLESIRLHTPETDVVIVGAFLDQVPKSKDHEETQDTLNANHDQSWAQGCGQATISPKERAEGPELTNFEKSYLLKFRLRTL